MRLSRLLPTLLALSALLALALVPGASAAGHGKRPQARSFTGTVAKVAPRRHALALRTTGRRTVRLRVRRATRGVRLAKLRKGQSVAVRAVRTRRGWVAARITVVKTPATSESDDDEAVDTEDESAEDVPMADDGDTAGDDESATEESPDDPGDEDEDSGF